MKKILTGWTVRRLIYLLIGIFILLQSVWEVQWFGILAGGYFASMGLFAFGCAAANCYVPKQSISSKISDPK
jgi:hypothetical protein